MFNPLTVIAIVCLYVGLLYLIALAVERGSNKVKRIAGSPWVYTLALAVYCTSWTYYGSVGSAANSGMLFLTVYLGPTLAIALWWFVIRKLIRIKSTRRITSIADFISARYGKSQTLAAIATLLALIGTTPYIALQLKAVTSTFTLITASESVSGSLISNNVGPVVVVLMIVFTIIMGVRRLDPTERHEGVMAALAVESVVKLLAFLLVGLFVTYFIYDGMGDIFQKLSASASADMLNIAGQGGASYLTWMTYLILAMSAIMFLPRQFHVTVVENPDENHLKTAIWLFPLYLFLINIFVVPIAAGGVLQGLPKEAADTYVLGLPLLFGQSGLALAVFIGGFSAATGMIIVSAMTTSTMITNHLLLPLVSWAPGLGFVRRHLLRVRWVAVAVILILGYGFERLTGNSYTLVNMGIISFAAVLQFAPIILGGLFWKRASKIGAILGLSAGFIIWFYTLLLPSFIRSGWLSTALLDNGLGGIEFLNPEQLFGLLAVSPLTHTVFWSMFFNIGLFVLGSLYFEPDYEEKRTADTFVGALLHRGTTRSLTIQKANIVLADKVEVVETLLHRYFGPAEADNILNKCLGTAQIKDKSKVSVVELTEFYSEVERYLAGSIGAAAAHKEMNQITLFTQHESKELSDIYSEILAELRVSPDELQKRINYYQEKEVLLSSQATELEKQVTDRTRALEITSAISHQMTTLSDIDELMFNITERIYAGFSYQAVYIYLADEESGHLMLAEGAGELAQQLKSQGHRIKRGEGIVGAVATTNQYFMANDISRIPDNLQDPRFPNTKSELAVPMHIGARVIGVLDVHCAKTDRFNSADVSRMQSIANQLVVSIDNARLLTETQIALEEVQRLNQRLTRETWQDISEKVETTGYTFTKLNTMPASTEWSSAMARAIQQKRLTYHVKADDGNGQEGAGVALAIPLMLRGEVIGVIGIERSAGRWWSSDELTTINAITEQVALALDAARLARQTERAAWRDRVVSESTAQVWSSAEIEEVMRTAVAQLGDKLRASEVVLRLGTQTGLEDKDNNL